MASDELIAGVKASASHAGIQLSERTRVRVVDPGRCRKPGTGADQYAGYRGQPLGHQVSPLEVNQFMREDEAQLGVVKSFEQAGRHDDAGPQDAGQRGAGDARHDDDDRRRR